MARLTFLCKQMWCLCQQQLRGDGASADARRPAHAARTTRARVRTPPFSERRGSGSVGAGEARCSGPGFTMGVAGRSRAAGFCASGAGAGAGAAAAAVAARAAASAASARLACATQCRAWLTCHISIPSERTSAALQGPAASVLSRTSSITGLRNSLVLPCMPSRAAPPLSMRCTQQTSWATSGSPQEGRHPAAHPACKLGSPTRAPPPRRAAAARPRPRLPRPPRAPPRPQRAPRRPPRVRARPRRRARLRRRPPP